MKSRVSASQRSTTSASAGKAAAALAPPAYGIDFVDRGPDAAPIQRVRILLRNEDPHLLGLLRQVPVPNEGAQTLQDPANVGTLNQIGANESIILEGHGVFREGCFGPSVVSQGGITAPNLALLARNVPKPALWTGSIYLLGCRTGELTTAVSKEYFTRVGQAVRVLGTKASIRVGRDGNDDLFIGTDWADEPLGRQPVDLAFIAELDRSVKLYGTVLTRLATLVQEIGRFAQGIAPPGNAPPISENLVAIGTAWAPFAGIDVTSANAKVPLRDYKLAERQAIDADYQAVDHAIRQISIFAPPDGVTPSANAQQEQQEIANAAQALTAFANRRNEVAEIGQYVNGLRLKPIDLANAADMKSAKKRRTTTLKISHWADAP